MSISAPASPSRASSASRRDVVTATVDVAPTAARRRARLCSWPARRSRGRSPCTTRSTRIKVKPDWTMARVGGVTFPKMLAQFEAWAFHNGPDGKPDTADDIKLGLVDAAWSMEEYTATYDDDDIKFVGTLDAATGPLHAERRRPESGSARASRNNIGDVWVVASYTPTPARQAGARCARARTCW